VIWLDVNITKPGFTPKPALSEHNFYKFETNLFATSNFLAVRKKVQDYIELSDEFITDGLVIHEGLQKSLTLGAFYTRVRKYTKGNRTTTKMQAVDARNWKGLVSELGDFSQNDCVVMDMAVLVTKDSALESTNSSAVNSLLAPLSTPATKNVLPDCVLINFYAPVINRLNPNASACAHVTPEPLKFDLTPYQNTDAPPLRLGDLWQEVVPFLVENAPDEYGVAKKSIGKRSGLYIARTNGQKAMDKIQSGEQFLETINLSRW
jgi:hypothetical protein